MKITVVGAGYVGLVSGSCLANIGHEVTCVERDAARVTMLNNGIVPIYEPGLGRLIAANRAAERLDFTSDLAGSVGDADAVFIAVGTPSRTTDGVADLSHVYQAAREIAPALRGHTLIVTKSTVPVGTGDEIERVISKCNASARFAVVSNPEFLREGSAIADFRKPDRVVIGADDEGARRMMSAIYAPLRIESRRMVYVSRRTAELIKYASNSFLAMKVTFINEIADLCEKVDADVTDVAHGMGLDHRIGESFLMAGPGIGGSCFPKDTLALVKTAQDADSPVRLVEMTVAINDQRKRAMAKKIIRACGGSVRGKTIGILGLTFKPDTDDVREAVSLSIIRALQDAGARVRAYDPEGMEHARPHLPGVVFCPDAMSAASDVDALAIVTAWSAFRDMDLAQLKTVMADPRIVDFQNMLDPQVMRLAGFTYTGLGRGEADRSSYIVQAAE
ncbi:MAG: UDP-glucose/GDP-mannose dehydrogenase family protein [Rhizobiaceae bacterium]